MTHDWLHRIAPYPRPSPAALPEEHSYTGRAFHSPGWLEPLRVIYDHELVLFRDGLFRMEIEGVGYLCEPGTFLIIPPAKWEATWNVGTTRGSRWWCHFDWTYRGPWGRTPIMTYHPATPKEAFFRRAPGFFGEAIHHGKIPQPAFAYDLFERLLQKQNRGDSHERLASRALLLELLLHLLDKSPAKRPRERSVYLAETVRAQLKSAVESGQPLGSVRATLEKMHFSYAHLCRLFHAEYGITPMQYIHTLRIDLAKPLLRETSLGVAEIGYRVGVADPIYFSRLFRKITGLTPSEYRRDCA